MRVRNLIKLATKKENEIYFSLRLTKSRIVGSLLLPEVGLTSFFKQIWMSARVGAQLRGVRRNKRYDV